MASTQISSPEQHWFPRGALPYLPARPTRDDELRRCAASPCLPDRSFPPLPARFPRFISYLRSAQRAIPTSPQATSTASRLRRCLASPWHRSPRAPRARAFVRARSGRAAGRKCSARRLVSAAVSGGRSSACRDRLSALPDRGRQSGNRALRGRAALLDDRPGRRRAAGWAPPVQRSLSGVSASISASGAIVARASISLRPCA